jgi:hypothetical protein
MSVLSVTWDTWVYNFPLQNSSPGVSTVIHESIVLARMRGCTQDRKQWGAWEKDMIVTHRYDQKEDVSLSFPLFTGGILDDREYRLI